MCTNHFKRDGFLTEDDIAFLNGSNRPGSKSQRSRARERIRHRVAAAMHDFDVLIEHWPDEQQRKTLDLIEDNGKRSIEELGADMIAFLYLFFNSRNTRSDIVLDENPEEELLRFRSSLCRGIRKGNQAFGNSPGVVSVASTTPLYETPNPETVREEVSSKSLTDAHQKLNQKYRRSEAYEDDGIIIDDREEAIKDLFGEWEEIVTTEIVRRRLKTSGFIRPLGTTKKNLHGYRDDFEKNPNSED